MTRPDTHPQDVDPELAFHVEMLTRRYVEEGLDPNAARAKAVARMGDLSAAQRDSLAIQQQTAAAERRVSWMQTVAQDLRHAFRVLRRSPGYVAITVGMIALATGASAAVFSVVDGVILRSSVAGAESVAMVLARQPDGALSAIPRDQYEVIATQLPASVEAVGVHDIASPIATGINRPKRTQTVCLSAAMPQVMGTRPLMGRWFSSEEARPGSAPVAVVSFNFWRRALGGDPGAVGRVIALDGTPVAIIGVMPAGFDGPYPRLYREIWVPYSPSAAAGLPFGCRPLGATLAPLARMRPGASLATATREVNAVAGSTDLVLNPYTEATVGDLRNPFNALVGAVLAVLLIAMANVTNLSLERMSGRRQELAVRMALGASRGRIVRESIAEHLVVALLGAATGLALAAVSIDAVMALLPPWLPQLDAISLNTRVLAITTGLVLMGGVLSGALAAWHTPPALRDGLASGDRGQTRGHSRTRRLLVIGELALGVVVLVAALLMIRTYLTLRPSNPGFDPNDKHIALVRLPSKMSKTDRLTLVEQVSSDLRTHPGIRGVAMTTSVPMRRSGSIQPATMGTTTADVYTSVVSPNYFDLMKIPIRLGRGFSDVDRSGSTAVSVVNETFVRRWFGDANPLGATFTISAGTSRAATLTVVGVVADTRSFGHNTRTSPFVYTPSSQSDFLGVSFVVDADARATAALPDTIATIVDRRRPGQLVDEVEALMDEMSAEVAQPRLGAWLFGVFAGLAILLGAVGLAATLAWMVTHRRREIGIRMALGARSADVRNLVVGQTVLMSVVGIALGLLIAAAATRLLTGWLYGVTALDASTFVACGMAMLAVSGLAAYVPTRRATRINPIIALRGE